MTRYHFRTQGKGAVLQGKWSAQPGLLAGLGNVLRGTGWVILFAGFCLVVPAVRALAWMCYPRERRERT